MSWREFDPGWPGQPVSFPVGDTIKTEAPEAARTRNASELSAKIKAAGGALTVNANDSSYIVAVNNGLRFSVTRLNDGTFRITESMNFILLIGVAAVVGLLLLSQR